jgi:cell division protein FtsL
MSKAMLTNCLISLLLILVLSSSLGVIYCKYRARQIFVEIQNLERGLDQYEVDWGKLQLELTTLAEQNRVERIARSKLKLVMPQRENIIFIKP